MGHESDNRVILEKQLVGFQEQLAFQQRTLDQLNEVVTEQQKHIEQLKIELNIHKKSIEELREGQQGDLPHDKPPHY